MKISTKTPIRLLDPVLTALYKVYGESIDSHGASFAVNCALAELLKEKGQKIPELVPPKGRIANGQKKRWRAARKDKREIEKKAKERKERRAKAEKERRARIKAEAAKDTEIV